jgi:flagellar biosynthesis protein FliP
VETSLSSRSVLTEQKESVARTARAGRGWLTLLALAPALAGCAAMPGAEGAAGGVLPLNANGSPESVGLGLQLLVILTVLSLAPSILMMTTSFIRIVIVLSFARNAIGVPQLPPNQIVLGLALFLTMFVMAPTWDKMNTTAVQPYLKGELTSQEAYDTGLAPLRTFMFKQTREKDLSLFVEIGKIPQPRNQDDVPTHVLVPAFIISELKTGFQMGFLILLPFLVIDMVVSSVLMAMGMMMLPPATISLPFKILLFVLMDGWHLIARSLLESFQ